MIRTLLLLALCAPLALAQDAEKPAEKKENPRYAAWKTFKAGSWASHTTTRKDDGNLVSTKVVKRELASVAEGKLKLKYTSTTTKPGEEGKTSSYERELTPEGEVKAAEGEGDAKKKRDRARNNVQNQDSEESLEIGGKTFACKKRVTTFESARGVKSKVTRWTCATVPGGLVKQVTETSRKGKPTVIETVLTGHGAGE